MNRMTILIPPLRISPQAMLRYCAENRDRRQMFVSVNAASEPGHRFHQVFVDDPIVYSRAYAAWTKHYQGLPDRH